MKLRRILSLLCITFVISLISCKKEAVVDIDGEAVSLEEFNQLYYAQLKQNYNVKTNEEVDKIASNPHAKNPMLDKKSFLDKIIEHKLLAKLAKDSGIFNTDKLKSLIKFQEQRIVAAYYSKVVLIDKIEVTEADIKKEYKLHRRRFKNAPIDKVEVFLKNYILGRKFQEKTQEIVKNMKEKSKIEKNQITLQKLTNPDKSKRAKSGWVAKINSETISVEEFENLYYSQFTSIYHVNEDEIDKLAVDPVNLKENPLLDKKEFLEQIIRQKLIYAKAKEEKILEDKELQTVAKVQTEIFMIGHYIKEKYPEDLAVTEQDIANIYNRYKKNYAGYPFDKVEIDIKRRLKGMKFNERMARLVQEQKEKVIIKKNLELLEKKAEKKEEKSSK